MNETTITMTGNLVDDPELRYTPQGQPTVRFRIALTPRFYDKASGQWKDGESLFMTCNLWRQAAENAAESLNRGGTRIHRDEVGVSLLRATAKVSKLTRTSGGEAQAGKDADPWASEGAGYSDEPPF
jgi:single-strand DNA-binding protein